VKAAVVTPLPWHLRVLPVADVTANPKYGNNRATAVFYGLKSIRSETRNRILGWNFKTTEGKKDWRFDMFTKAGCVDPKHNYADFINEKVSLDTANAIQFRLRVKCSLDDKEGATKPTRARLYWASDKDMQRYAVSNTFPFVEARAISLANLSRDGIEWSADLRKKTEWQGNVGGVMLRLYFTDDALPREDECIQISIREMEFLGEAKPGQVIAWEDGDYGR
jgi:hypothetical protein